jgi:hypothetical protein
MIECDDQVAFTQSCQPGRRVRAEGENEQACFLRVPERLRERVNGIAGTK